MKPFINKVHCSVKIVNTALLVVLRRTLLNDAPIMIKMEEEIYGCNAFSGKEYDLPFES